MQVFVVCLNVLIHAGPLRLLALTILLPVLALAQSAQGRISGTVADPNSAVVPGVEVVAANEGTGTAVRGRTNEVGVYVLPFLQPGPYTITAKLSGFKTYIRTGIVVETSQVMELNIAMELGALSETVTVTAEAPLLQSTESTVGQFVDQRTVEAMPLANRRASELVRLSSDTVFTSYDNAGKPIFALGGGRSFRSAYLLDGGNVQNIRLASLQVDLDPPSEAVQEFRMVQNGYAAEFGGSGSGLLISTTKSGTNAFHGSLFEYFRNDRLDAAGFFAPTEGGRKKKAPLRYNLFGGSLGGPVIRNRTHFFASYEGKRQPLGSTQVLTVPTPEQIRGDFSRTFDARGALIPIYDPTTTRMEAGRQVRNPFPGNIIPAGRLDPVAVGLAKYWPSPNRPAVNLAGAQNFSANRARKDTRDNITSRVDHAFSDNNRLFFRMVYARDEYAWTSVYPSLIGDPQSPMSPDRYDSSYFFKDTHTFTPSLIADFGFSLSDRTWYADSAGLGSGIVKQVGLPGITGDAFPTIGGTGMAGLGSGSERTQKPIRQYQITSSWTWVRGNHVLKFGGESRKAANSDLNRPLIAGSFAFNKTGTEQPGVTASGVPFASYMLGWVNGFSMRETEQLDRYGYYLAWYAQDDWKVSRDLTLNLGLRWETDTPIVDRNNRFNSFDPYQVNPVSGTAGVVKFGGVGGWPTQMYNADWNNLGPRFGFAWKPWGSEKLVVRGGYGIFYEAPSTSANSASLGFELSAATSSPDNGITPAFLLREGPKFSLDKRQLNDSFGAVRVGAAATTNVTYYDLSRRTGYAQHLSLGIQRQFAGNMVLEVRYSGNLARKLPNGDLAMNQVRPELLGPGNAQVKRPYPQFNGVSIMSVTDGNNNYHSGTARLEKRLSHGVTLLAGYTWSRSIGNAFENGPTYGDNQHRQDLYNARLDRGPDALDLIHRFVFSSAYELPWGHNRRWLSSGWLAPLLGGWTLGTVASLQSGGPFTVVMVSNTTNSFSAGGLRANILRDARLPVDQRTVDRWFDTSAFAAPAPYTFGNAGRGVLRGDGRAGLDVSLSKNFVFGDGKYVGARADFFNALNHPDFFLPNRTMGAANFGTISGATSPRSIQLGLRVNF